MPLHRSLVFWGGFGVFVFLVWAWKDSLEAYSSLVVNWWGRGREIQLNLGPGAVGVITGHIDAGLAEMSSYSRMELIEGEEEASFDFWQGSLTSGMNGGISFVYVPLRFVFFAFVPVWLGLSVWRGWRIGKRRRSA
jgi:hypothetical protein